MQKCSKKVSSIIHIHLLDIYGLQHDWHRLVAAPPYRRHRTGTEDQGGIFLPFHRHRTGCRAVLRLHGNGTRRLPHPSHQPHRRHWRRRQGLRYDTLSVRPLERGHPHVPRDTGQHGVADEQGRRFGGFRPLGKQACEEQDGRAVRHHPARHPHIHRRLLQLSHRRLCDAPHRRAQRCDEGEARLSHRLHGSARLHHLPHLQLGGGSVGLRVGRRERPGTLLQGDTVQFLRLLHHPLPLRRGMVWRRLQGDEQV